MVEAEPLPPLPASATEEQRTEHYAKLLERLKLMLEDEEDPITAMSTLICDLHFALDYAHWTGFYRVVSPGVLAAGPYQGSLGCLRIPFDKGVCGAAARTRLLQLVPNVEEFPGHIACASTTQSEIVVPVICPNTNVLIAVLDVDSNFPAAFTEADAQGMTRLCEWLGSREFCGKLVDETGVTLE